MKLDQLACYAHDEAHAEAIRAAFGIARPFDGWVNDTVTGLVTLPRMGIVGAISVGQLRFNYDLGMEFEILTYLDGPHWHGPRMEYRLKEGFVSHVGFHLDADEDWPAISDDRLVQEMVTQHHTNAHLNNIGRTYHYRIYDFTRVTGMYHKFIRRLHVGK